MNELPHRRATILVDIDLVSPEPLDATLTELLGSLTVILVGWYAVPEQTSPEQAREAFAGEARAALENAAGTLRAQGADVHPRLVFTANELETVERISTEEDCDAVLIAQPLDRLEHVLIPLRGLHNAERIAHVVSDLIRSGPADITLLHVLEEGEAKDIAKADILGQVSNMMIERGTNARLIHHRLKLADDPGKAIISFAKDYDLVVIGETQPSVREVIFGSIPEQIAQNVDVPVMVVRRRNDSA